MSKISPSYGNSIPNSYNYFGSILDFIKFGSNCVIFNPISFVIVYFNYNSLNVYMTSLLSLNLSLNKSISPPFLPYLIFFLTAI